MHTKVSRYIDEHSLLSKEATHLVALSGGADSVCLLLVMKSLGYKVEAVHCNFHLRGDESNRDEIFCKDLCERDGIPFHLVHFDTVSYAELHKVSIEMAARELRYRYFEQLRQDVGAETICVAHHKDDNVETVLMNLVRGTGLTGLIGIRPRNGRVVRPLLCVSRQEIVEYLDRVGQGYVVDSTNLINEFTRNKLRLDVIPLLEQINPSFKDNVVCMTNWLSAIEKVTDKAMLEAKSNVVSEFESGLKISIDGIKNSSSPEYLLFTILYDKGFASHQITDIAEKLTSFISSSSLQSGKLWSSDTHILVVDRDNLLLAEKKEKSNVYVKIPEDGKYIFIHEGEEEAISIEHKTVDFSLESFPEELRLPDVAVLDADKVKFPLILRNVENGDRFVPFGMKGTKLINDYMTDRKFNYFQRQRQLVLLNSEGEIVWLVGQRPDARSSITKNTINLIVVRYFHK